ncbi:2-dehydro-3-deoxygalactonokinase [Aureimonas pseudogalii]|uniref:2-dehydro-3-deoxygalactonokinase n=1 Tax=Aureimonas pseudogalii TaxID=1744844 RepID=A0A7W6EB47_9HYPH|nr:2-dehydro-3-deoxygalactonokinase [Aureimonas pseudogalii]MBB3998080.1 2-dehydro-3-deoxygalactonokinase [Aureimonas pseudogalii]
MSREPAYAAIDWGTTSFRAWACAADGTVLGERRAADGLISAADRGFETVLEGHLSALGLGSSAPVVMCGMVGSRTGWVEAAYLDTPIGLDGLAAQATPVPASARPVFILPGLAQRSPVEPDVMRGEETQLLGVVADGLRTGFVCMPGTHSKWVRLEDGTIESFSTFMTGELFQHLRTHSILRQAVETATAVDATLPAFTEAVRHVLEEPALATNRLFQIRAGWLLAGRSAGDQLARLSGTLIGLEIAGAQARYGDLTGAALLASGPIAALYDAAFAVAGFGTFRPLDADRCVRHGLHAAACTLFSLASTETPA